LHSESTNTKMIKRKFSSYGPVNAKYEYCAPREELIQTAVNQLVGENSEQGGHYFTVWAPRQTGKTWVMWQTMYRINTLDNYTVICISVGILKDIEDRQQIFESFKRLLESELNREFPKFLKWDDLKSILSKEGPYSRSLSNMEDNRIKAVDLAAIAYGDPAKFVWSFGDGTYDSTTLYPSHEYAAFGTYNVCLSVSDPVSGEWDKFCNEITLKDTSFIAVPNYFANETDIEIAPNPFHNKTNIIITLQQPAKISVEVLDVMGNVIKILPAAELQEGTQVIPIENTLLKPGYYIVKIGINGEWYYRRVVGI